mmetsp:Transcript_12462/g.29650  ORF Transcript_12462/g.29650 Transcript_12462/m.29650 type:complete len:239 (+) Transcript_12462:295-1011(+)
MPCAGSQFSGRDISAHQTTYQPACSSFASAPKVCRTASAVVQRGHPHGRLSLTAAAVHRFPSRPCGCCAAPQRQHPASLNLPLEALRLAAVALHPLQIPLLCILCTRYLEEVLEGPFPPQTPADGRHHKTRISGSESRGKGPNPPHLAALVHTARTCSQTASCSSMTFFVPQQSAGAHLPVGTRCTPRPRERYHGAHAGCAARRPLHSRSHSLRRSVTRRTKQNMRSIPAGPLNARSS